MTSPRIFLQHITRGTLDATAAAAFYNNVTHDATACTLYSLHIRLHSADSTTITAFSALTLLFERMEGHLADNPRRLLLDRTRETNLKLL